MQLIHQIVTILLSDSDTIQVPVAPVRSPEHALGSALACWPSFNNLEQVERLITLTRSS